MSEMSAGYLEIKLVPLCIETAFPQVEECDVE